MFKVIYIPRVDDEVAVAQFTSKEEAEEYMEVIKEKRPKAYPHHYIKEQQE
jgi:hypothetical protein